MKSCTYARNCRTRVVENVTRQHQFQERHSMSPRQVQFLLGGGLINWMKERISAQ